MWKELKPAERSSAIPQKTKNRNGSSKKRKKQIVKQEAAPQLEDIDYIEELKTQLTYGDTGHGVILDKKV